MQMRINIRFNVYILKKQMKIISKIIVWILSIIFLFVVVNLGIGLFKYKSISNYANFLNQKDRHSSISQIDITNPMSILSLFYGEYTPLPKNIDLDENSDLDLIEDWDLDVQQKDWLNVYDPEFEDDFNEFFGTTHTWNQKEKPQDEEVWFVAPQEAPDQNTQAEKTAWQELLERFSQ